MHIPIADIVAKADRIVKQCGTRDPHGIADCLGVQIMRRSFHSQRGAYKVFLRNRFLFVKEDLDQVMERIVLLHELGHDTLHRVEATQAGVFPEFNIFNVRDNRMEYEANAFAAQVALPDKEFLDLVEQGYDTQQIASILNSDVNLVALKADTLISRGYRLRRQEHQSDFLRYDR